MDQSLFDKLSKHRRSLAKQLKDPAVSGLWNMVVDKYSAKAHFIFELLQNADDAEATCVRILVKKDAFVFIHNGRLQFSVTDPETEASSVNIGHLNALTSIGSSTKQLDENKIGRFGIGFKSVFQYTNCPHVEDDCLSFRLEDYIVPIKEDRIGGNLRKNGETLFYIPFSNPQNAFDEILNCLSTISNPLVFLHHITHLEWGSDSKTDGCCFGKEVLLSDSFSTPYLCNICHKVVRLNNLIPEFEHYHFFETDIAYSNKRMKCSIVYGCNQEGCLEPIHTSDNIYCFFTTEENFTALPFIAHAPFILTENRELIKKEELWNKKMFDTLAYLASSIFFYKVFSSSNSYQKFLDFFPIDENSNVDSYKPFIDALVRTLVENAVLKTKNGSVINAGLSLYCEESFFTSIPINVLAAKFKDKDWCYSFLYGCSSEGKNRYMTFLKEKELISECLDLDQILPYISSDYLKSQTDEWLVLFYRTISKYKAFLKSDMFRLHPIFKCEDGEFRSVYNQMKSPQLFLRDADGQYANDTSHFVSSLFQENKLLEFCENSGISSSSDSSYVENLILGSYQNHLVDRNNMKELADDLVRLSCYFNKTLYKPNIRQHFIQSVKTNPFLATIKDGDAIFSVPQCAYFESANLKLYFGNNPSIVYVDPELLLSVEPKDRDKVYYFLQTIGVSFYPKILSIERIVDNSVYDIYDLHPKSLRSRDNGGQIVMDKEIDGFSYFESHWSEDSAIAFFHLLGCMVGECGAYSFTKELTGYYTYYEKGKKNVTEEHVRKTTAIRTLFDCKWLPTSSHLKIDVHQLENMGPLNDHCFLLDTDRYTCQYLGIEFSSELQNLTSEQRRYVTLVKKLASKGVTEEMLNDLLTGKATIKYKGN